MKCCVMYNDAKYCAPCSWKQCAVVAAKIIRGDRAVHPVVPVLPWPCPAGLNNTGQLSYTTGGRYNINWNYGLLPQTWEDPSHSNPDVEGAAGDNDPGEARKEEKARFTVFLRVHDLGCLYASMA